MINNDFIHRAPWGTVVNGRHACAMESVPPSSASGKPPQNATGTRTYLSLVTTISTWAFGQQACMIYMKNKLFSRASSVLVTINSPIHRKVHKNGKHLAAACCSLLGKKKTSVGFLFAGSLENITQYLPHCNFFNPKKLPPTFESIVALNSLKQPQRQ